MDSTTIFRVLGCRTPKVCKVIAFEAVLRDFGLLYYFWGSGRDEISKSILVSSTSYKWSYARKACDGHGVLLIGVGLAESPYLPIAFTSISCSFEFSI